MRIRAPHNVVHSSDLRSFYSIRIGRACPLLAVVKRLKPLTALSGTVYRLASSISDHTPVLFSLFRVWGHTTLFAPPHFFVPKYFTVDLLVLFEWKTVKSATAKCEMPKLRQIPTYLPFQLQGASPLTPSDPGLPLPPSVIERGPSYRVLTLLLTKKIQDFSRTPMKKFFPEPFRSVRMFK